MSRAGRLSLAASMLAGCLLLGLGDRDCIAPRLLFNTTASAPIGFYVLTPGRPIVGEWVAILPPPDLARWMAVRGYLPANVPLLKEVAAVSRQQVCGHEGVLLVDGAPVARMRSRDRWGRALTPFTGCQRLADDEVLLVNRHAANSLDSRYFGPLPSRGIVGRARPLWTWETRS